MNIFDHLIPDKYILGIGCLMRDFDVVNKKVRFYFDLHLVAHTTTIKSEWLSLPSPTEDEDRETKERWKEQYDLVKERVAKLIGEETDLAKLHLQQVDQTYKDTLKTMEDLLEMLEPSSPEVATPVNLKTTRLAQNIKELKELAIK